MIFEVLFWVLLVPLTIISFIVYVKTQKLYQLMYLLSIFTYVITVGFVVESYSLGTNSILLILIISAIAMIAFGLQYAKHGKTKTRQVTKKSKKKGKRRR